MAAETGKEVFGQALVIRGNSGAFAEIVAVNNDTVAPKPKTASFEEAAALPLVGSSAIQGLEEHIKLQSGQKILIHGGAGGIGHIAIQLAKALGAYVATTVKTGDMEFVKELGADQVIDYKNQKFEGILKDFDAVYDTVGSETANKSFQVLKRSGILVSMLGQPDVALAQKYGVRAIGQMTAVTTARLNRLASLIDGGKIKVHVDKVFPLENVKEAFDYQQKNRPRGKVVLRIGSS
ncbi:NADP-dependent oxidoreductase [Candidatus Microgenomates bacterium]|nr:NADP-dependent oxidoreductase [Candidatus Microgenomates bacterium]